MASSKEYLDFILDQLADLEEIQYRKMMGEYILYYRGKIFGGIYDDRLLVKPADSALEYIGKTKMDIPYEGAKSMILIEDPDDRESLQELVRILYTSLPEPKKKNKDRNRL